MEQSWFHAGPQHRRYGYDLPFQNRPDGIQSDLLDNFFNFFGFGRSSGHPSAQANYLHWQQIQGMESLFRWFANTGEYHTPAFVPEAAVTRSEKPVDVQSLLQNYRGTPDDRKSLESAMELLNADGEGRLLLAEAARRDIRFEVSRTLEEGVNGYFDPSSNLIVLQPPDKNENFLKTLAHELVHAVTPENHDSLLEEGVANHLGYRIQDRLLNGRQNSAGNFMDHFREFISQPAYLEELPVLNDIVHRLAAMGFRPPQHEMPGFPFGYYGYSFYG